MSGDIIPLRILRRPIMSGDILMAESCQGDIIPLTCLNGTSYLSSRSGDILSVGIISIFMQELKKLQERMNKLRRLLNDAGANEEVARSQGC